MGYYKTVEMTIAKSMFLMNQGIEVLMRTEMCLPKYMCCGEELQVHCEGLSLFLPPERLSNMPVVQGRHQ